MKHIVGFSGGIDSQSCARWVLNRYPAEDVILLNSDAGGNENHLTTEFIAWYSRNVFPVITMKAKVGDLWKTEGAATVRGYDENELLDFPRLIEIKGPPPRTRRTCTEFLKLAPQRRWIQENLPGEDYCRYSGVRRDESEGRKNTKLEDWDKYYDCPLYHPIADWTKQMCFDYVKRHGERINQLYTLGFDRVGCAPCILSGKDDLSNWALRFPEEIDKVRSWEQRTGKTFFMSQVPGLKEASIDDMVRWALSARGGRQDLFPIMHYREACESKYGLCE